MKQINVFNKGGVSDIDQSLIQNDRFVFPTLNVRLTNYKGKGLVPTTIEGNELAFDLNDLHIGDCTIYGAVEYNGVLYMAIGGGGISTIASYPSPKWVVRKSNTTPPIYRWTIDANQPNEFESKVKPIVTIQAGQQWNGALGLVLEGDDDIFNFTTHVEMIARPSYDGSVDLYLADYTNENKVVNTCFNQVPELLSERLISASSMKQLYSHILYAGSIAKIELDSLQRGGKNKPGNYFIALRYLDTNFNRTTFSALSRPISVVNTFTVGTDTTIIGVQEMEWLSNDQQYTNSSIVIDIEDIDTSMAYYELAIIRYSSLQENSIPEPDIYLIDKYYDITSTSATITINGLEQTRLVSIDEIIELENYFRISNSHQQIADRYIGVNWKSIKNKDIEDAVKDFALACTMGYSIADSMPDYTYDQLRQNAFTKFQYLDVDNIHNKLGYFLDEVYPYSMYVQFKNGYKSKIYPLTGTSNNEKGLVYFNHQLNTSVDTAYTSGFKAVFFNADIDSYLLEQKDNIDSIVIVRGERSGNLVTNGFLYPVANRTDISGYRYFQSDADNEIDSVYVPLAVDRSSFVVAHSFISFESPNVPEYPTNVIAGDIVLLEEVEAGEPPSYASYAVVYNGTIWTSYTLEVNDLFFVTNGSSYQLYLGANMQWGGYTPNLTYMPYGIYDNGDYSYYKGTSSSSTTSRLALISPDFASSLDFEDGSHYLKTYFSISNTSDKRYDILPEIFSLSFHGEGLDVTASINTVQCQAYGIQKMVKSGAGRFSSMLRDGDTYDKSNGAAISFESNNKKYYNRSVYTCPYVGIELQQGLANNYIFKQASLFKSDPSTFFSNYLQSFNVETTQYKAIAIFSYSELETGGQTKSIYGGDCFNQLTYIRLLKFYDFDFNEHPYHIAGGIKYMHGMLLGFNSQNSINMQLRNNVKAETEDGVIEYTYFPHCERIGRNTEDFIYNSYQPDMMFEALQVNNGYNITLPTIGQLGFNEYEKTITSYENRVFVSAKHNSSSYVDAYRKILLDDYKDYELGKGAIIGIYEILGKICIVQKNQIFEIAIDERILSQENNIMIASSSDILSQEVRALSNFGAAHVNHIINTDFGLVGIDVKRKTLWLIEASLNDRGYRYLQAINFGEKLGIQHEFEKLLDANPKRTDVLGISFTDEKNKLILGYDTKYGELHLTIDSERDFMIEDYEILSEDDNLAPPPPPPPPPMFSIETVANNPLFGIVIGYGSYQMGSVVVVNALPSINYQFIGWYDNGTLVSTQQSYSFIAESNRLLTAMFQGSSVYISYLVSYGGTLIGQAIQNVPYNTYTSEVSVQPLISHLFTGWSDGLQTLSRSDLATSQASYTASFIVKSFTVVFRNWDTTILSTQTIVYGGDAIPPVATRAGYVFQSWSGAYTNIIANLDIYAIFNVQSFTVVFKDYNQAILKTQVVEYNSSATPPPDPIRIGYDFTGWDVLYTNIVADLTVTAQYQIQTFTVTFLGYANVLLKTEEVQYLGSATAPIPPTIEGWTFIEWVGNYTNVIQDLTITASYEETQPEVPMFTITFKSYAGNVRPVRTFSIDL